jgi:signal transduction histidine kinase/ActR/RegA family two-component response regulator
MIDDSLQTVERALAASEARFRTAIEKNADGVIVLSGEGRICFANPAAEVLLGRSASALVGALFGVPVVPGETTEVDVLRSGRADRVAEIRVVEIDWEGEPSYLASLRDVTERKQAAEGLRFLAEASRALAGSLDLPTTLETLTRVAVGHLADWCLLDILRPCQAVRRVAAHRDPSRQARTEALAADYTPSPHVPFGPQHVLVSGRSEFHPEVVPEVRDSLAQDVEGRRTVAELGCASALIVPLIARGQTLGALTCVRGGAASRYSAADLAVAQDFASRAALAVDNACLYDEAREAVRRRDEFLAMLAHELRNPLAPVRNAVEVLRLDGADSSHLPWVRTVIERQVQHLTHLVDDLLDVSRLTRGQIKLRKQPVELAQVISHALEASRPAIEAKEHHLDVNVPANAGRLEADATRLAQVVSNLLDNAAKYTPPGGHLRLSVEREQDRAVVRVRDDGIGIPAEMLASIFELFTQVDDTLDRAEGGLGIGLTLVRTLVELHGGSVQAHSKGRGHGSEFTLRLPLLPEPAAATGQGGAAGKPGADARPLRILVVDDNQDAAESLVMLLKLFGHEVSKAFDGRQALEAARAFVPDVVVCDIGMPGMSGYKVASALRALPGLEGALLVALTGFGTSADRQRAREAGFDHHLVKPAPLDELQRLLATLQQEGSAAG